MEYSGFEIAIVGMSGRFPGSKNVTDLWKNICDGKNLISYFDDSELLENGVPAEYLQDSNYVKARGIVGDIDKFDADLFGFYPKEIELLDPQQRMFLECCWEAMEDAGYTPDNYEGLAGVFGGIGLNTYVLQSLKSNTDFKVSAEAYQLSIANDKDFLATRVSYKLNMKGPSVDVQSACSTSLVATHIACMNLLNFQCDLALAGGCTINIPEVSGYHYQEGMILSSDGFCRPFDKDAGGTVASNGCGVVALKRLEDAIEDQDDIYAVIKGSAYNNDGSVKVGYTAPGVQGQSDVLSSAYGMADVPLNSIGYIETHGTGTDLGDPIEIDALKQVFNSSDIKEKSCAIGSIKSNVGHLDTAAGVTGLIKAALSVYHGIIPPSINFNSPNTKIDFTNSPFYVNTDLKKWDTKNSLPRRAGVSSFGIGGTNVHVVLEEPPPKEKSTEKNVYRIIPFSAKTKQSLDGFEKQFIEYLSSTKERLSDIALTLQNGRKEFEHRKFTVAKDIEQVTENLKKSNLKVFSNNKIAENPSIIFMFSGQGSQYTDMCKDLYNGEERFRSHFDKCNSILINEHGFDINKIIYQDINDEKYDFENLNQTKFTQPALFVIEYSLAMTLLDFGIKPNSMVGHSIGEYVAACISGVMDLSSALNLVTKRGELMQDLESGSMLSVNLSENNLVKILPAELDLAVVNSPNICVVSGTNDEIGKFKDSLKEKEISSTVIRTSHAFHSKMMDPVLNEFKSYVSKINLKPPSIPYMSNVSGNFITESEATDPEYYANHLRYTVRFSDNIKNYLKEDDSVLLEVGPGSTLCSLAKQHLTESNTIIAHTVRHRNQEINDIEMFMTSIGNLWLAGAEINWEKFSDDNSLRVHLPTYVFDKKRYWIKSLVNKHKKTSVADLTKFENWTYEYLWNRTPFNNNFHVEKYKDNILVFDSREVRISNLLGKSTDSKIVTIYPGDSFKKNDDFSYNVNPADQDDYSKLIKNIADSDLSFQKIIHAWSTRDYNIDGTEKFNSYQDYGYLSLLYLINAIQNIGLDYQIDLNILTSGIFDIIGNEKIIPDKSTILGAVRVINQEVKNISTSITELDDLEDKSLLRSIPFLLGSSKETQKFAAAIRGRYSWQQSFNRIKLNGSEQESLLKTGGTYLITGGLGRIGLVFAKYLAKQYSANIILVDRYEIPQEINWIEYLASHDENDDLVKRIKILSEIENAGKSLTYFKADVDKINELEQCIQTSISKFENINGIIHAAGIVGDKMVRLINQFTLDDYKEQISSKVIGTKNISYLIKDLPIDFVLIQSSLSSLLGGIGFSNYSAVNNFADTFCTLRSREQNNGTKWISVNWDGWNFNGEFGEKGINSDNGIKLLELALIENAPSNIIISTEDLLEQINKWTSSSADNSHVQESENNESELSHKRPDLDTDYIAPESEIEKKISKEWENLLGIEGIGVNDNFFDLGGDSLIGTQLVSRMRKIFNTDLPLVAVFENATIRGIAQILSEDDKADLESDKVSNVLDKINSMSEDEISKMLKDKT